MDHLQLCLFWYLDSKFSIRDQLAGNMISSRPLPAGMDNPLPWFAYLCTQKPSVRKP
ncbi:unnamed protein product [Prunus armeniaca]|uniref:Uncharacterized protein n=1 Tax=Prunus armeniaca TaxID=36596 RepID=A0A6J5WZS1_PRUAR|nr:unnamed protein product [Prunus armeniaca]